MRHVFYFFPQWTKRVMQRFLSNTEHKLPVDVSQNPLSLSRKEIGISPNLDFSGKSWREPHHQNINKYTTWKSLDVLNMAFVDSNPLIAWQKSKLQVPTLQVFLFEAFGIERNLSNLFQPDVYIPETKTWILKMMVWKRSDSCKHMAIFSYLY